MNEKQKIKKAAYMKEYNRKNKVRLYERKKELHNLKMQDKEYAEDFKKRKDKTCKKYRENNRDLLHERAKEVNHYYKPETAHIARKKHYVKFPARNILRGIKHRCKKKDIPFELTEKWYNELYDKGCSVLNIPFDAHGSDTPWVAHVDQKIPGLGYTIDNCRLVCAMYNIAKKHWKDEEVLKMAMLLIQSTTT